MYLLKHIQAIWKNLSKVFVWKKLNVKMCIYIFLRYVKSTQ